MKSILPFLDNSAYLPTSIYKNLRLVIQYSNAKNTTVNNNQLPTTLEPMLIVDEVLDPNKQSSIANSYKGVQFQAIEHDRVYLNAFPTGAQAGDTQEQTFTVGGFDNKRVGRIVVVNSLTDATAIDADVATVGLGSQSQYNQKIQLRVNGQSKFWQSGIARPIFVTDDGIATLANELQSSNAPVPMLVTDDGIVRLANELHREKEK